MVSIQNNLGNMRSQDALAQSHRVLQVSLERLSTGIRINRAEDDAAGVMVRDRFQAQMNGFEEAVRNIQAGQSMIQVAEQGLNKITEGLQQMRALAIRAADDNLNDDDRGRIQHQVKGLLREINERAQRTIYNGHNLLNGSIADSHEARDGSTKIQTNSFLANGNKLITGTQTTGVSATTPNGISQGSYQVKLVYDANHRDNPIATTLTTLGGTASSGHGYLNSTTSPVTVTQAIYDTEGNSHDVNITFSNTGANTWQYVMTSGAGGTWTNPINVTGNVAFNNNGEFNGVNVTGGMTTANASGAMVNVKIADGTASGQMWAVDFSRLRESDESVVVNTPNFLADGVAGTETANATITGTLSAPALAGSLDGTTSTFIDRTGVSHTVNMDFQKTLDQTGGSDNADTWQLNVSGLTSGAWVGPNTNTSVSVEFDVAGNVVKVNGVSGNSFTMNIGDGTSGGQDITIDLSGLTNNAVAVPLSSTADGTIGTPTSDVSVRPNARLSSGYGPTTFFFDNLIDRTGTNSVSGGKITFTQVGDSNTWNYAVAGPITSGYTGAVTGGTGSVSFTEDGNLIGPTQFTAILNDGTTEGHQITVNLSWLGNELRMGRQENLSGTTSNGSAGIGDIRINAEIFYSGSEAPAQPVMTLFGVSNGAKSASLGGISFTVNEVSSQDVGLTGFVKAYTYVSATTYDNALQFHVGPDEGMIQRIGIQKMDVQTLFRGQDQTEGDYLYTDIELETTLQAQDLIGQLDDAIDFVSLQNLKIGQFQNDLTRTLDLQRQNDTSITNAYSLLNDADMADEATNQSKRSILVQSGTAMVAQSNTTSQFILQLLR